MKHGRVGHGEGDVHRLLDEHDGRAVVADRADDGQQLARRRPAPARGTARRSAAAAAGQERHRQREHLLLTARQVAGAAVERARERPGRARAPRRGARSASARSRRRATPPCGGSPRPSSVGNTPWPPGTCTIPRAAISLRRRVGDVAAVEHTVAPIRRHEAADRPQQGRLAGTVRAEQCDALAVVDVEVDAEQHLDAAVGHVEAADEQKRFSCPPPSARRRSSERRRARRPGCGVVRARDRWRSATPASQRSRSRKSTLADPTGRDEQDEQHAPPRRRAVCHSPGRNQRMPWRNRAPSTAPPGSVTPPTITMVNTTKFWSGWYG